MADGLQAFEIARRRYQRLQLVMFGTGRPRLKLPDYVEYHLNPPQSRLRHIYDSCDIWMCPSWVEGAGLTPQEAMACQCALVSTDVGAVRDYAVPGQTALVSPPRNPQALAENLLRLLDEETELLRISQAGFEKIHEFTWDRATAQLLSCFEAAP